MLAVNEIKTKNFNHGERGAYDSVMNKMNDLLVNLIERTMLYFVGGEDKVTITTGLGVTLDSGMDLLIADGLAMIPDDLSAASFLHFAAHLEETISISEGDPTNARIDIVQGRYEIVQGQQDSGYVYNSANITPQIFQNKMRNFYRVAISVKEGTPAPIPSVPSMDTGYKAFLQSTRDWAANPTVDLSSRYKIQLQIDDRTRVEINLQGATPNATTLSEIVTAINDAVGINVADGTGDILTIESEILGANGTVRMVPPSLDVDGNNVDCLHLIFPSYFDALPMTNEKTHVVSSNYELISRGKEDCFALAEIYVNAGDTSLTVGQIKDVYAKGSWASSANANKLTVGFMGYASHRLSDPMDHADGSVKSNHLDPSLLSGVTVNKLFNFRKKRLVSVGLDGGSNFKSRFTIKDVNLTDEAGALLTIMDGNYPLANALKKFVAGDFTFAHTVTISVPSAYSASCEQQFQISSDPDGLSRTQFNVNQVVVYCDTKGASTNDLFVRIIRVSDSNVMVEEQILASAIAGDGTYIIFPITPTALDIGVNYKLQFKQASPTVVFSGPAPSTINHRVHFRPEAGEYQDQADPVTDGMTVYIWDRETETVVKQIKGYAANLSDAGLWNSSTPNVFPYIEPDVGSGVDDAYAAVDVVRGRIKLPGSIQASYLDGFPERDIRVEGNFNVDFSFINSDNLGSETETDNKGLQTWIDDYLYPFKNHLKRNALNTTAITFEKRPTQSVKIDTNTTFTFSNQEDGGIYILIVKNTHATNPATITWPSDLRWPDDTPVDEIQPLKSVIITMINDTEDGGLILVTQASEYAQT